MAKRDNFTATTKALLAKRVAYQCSHPDCPLVTIGPALGSTKSVSTGEAAHITAAAPGGPRYDPSLTPEERKAFANGIWMCGVHAKQVDSDAEHFTVETLREWKRNAERKAVDELSTGRRTAHTIVKIEIEDDLLARLGFSQADDVDALADRMAPLAKDDLAGFMLEPGWPAHAAQLSFYAIGGSPEAFSLADCAAMLSTVGSVTIVSPPGTGKSTSLIQLCGDILSGGESIAIHVPLSEWSTQSESLLGSVTHRSAYKSASPPIVERDLVLLALHGRLIIALDGWNELDFDSRKRATNEIRRLQREFPLLEIVVSTRKQALDVPLPGRSLGILPLSENQQLDIARSMAGDAGEKLVDHAWRIPGLRELVSVPLYLHVLLARTPDGTMPTTKEEVLRLFIEEHERSPQNASALRDRLQGSEREFLKALAFEATVTANTAMLEVSSNRVIAATAKRLHDDGQIGPIAPSAVIDVLVDHHTLVRAGDRTVLFQHQQIQEWFSSLEVEDIIRKAHAGDDGHRSRLRTEILDMPAWEEAILFCCERLSRATSAGEQAVAFAITQALAVDPMLAANMIYRSSMASWNLVREEIISFATLWHTKNESDRAVRFMITTGKPEFAEAVWPLIDNPNSQNYLPTLRNAERFRPTVLGAEAPKRLAGLEDDRRGHVLASIAYESGMDGMELAASIAENDSSPEIQAEVIGALQFRRADRLVKQVLNKAHPETWTLLARKGYAEQIANLDVANRIRSATADAIKAETSAVARLRYLLSSTDDNSEVSAKIEAEISNPAFPADDDYADRALNEAYRSFPQAVAKGVLARLSSRLAMPFSSSQFLVPLPVTDEGPIVDIALDPASDRRFQKPASSLLGPKAIGQLIDRLLAVKRRVVANDGRWTKPDSDEHGWLQGLVTGTRVQPFGEAWLSRCNTDDPDAIGSLAELLSRHGTDFSQKEPLFEDVTGQKRLGDALQAHAGALLRSPASKRYQLASLGLAMARVGDRRLTEDLGRLANEDVKRWRASREDFARNRDRQANSEVSICHTGEFTRAIASLGGDEAREFLKSLLDDELASRDAAIALKLLWSQNNVPVEKDAQPKFGPDYSQVAAKRKRRTESPELTCPEARAILDVASKLISSDQGAQQKLAIDLAAIALQMPYGDEDQLVRALLGSSVPILEKFGLIRSLALSGQTVSAELVLGGISGYLDAAETKTWMLDPNSRWSLLQWLDLIPFSDRPAAVLDALKLIPTKYYAPWDLRGLFTAMQNSPDATIEATFFAVAEATPELLTEDWLGALLARKSRATVLSLLDGCLDPKLGPHLLKSFTHFRADRLAEIVAQHPALRAEIAARYQDARYAPAYRIIEDLLARSPDDDTIVLMVRKYGENKRMNDHNLDRAIERVVTENRPVPDWPEAYNVHPVAAVELRKKLFALTVSDGHEANIARACLTQIDVSRDENGRPETEPRHPDIATGRSWPILPP